MRCFTGLAILIITSISVAAEVEVLNETALRRARTLIEEGDVSSALPIVFKILRNAPDKEHRDEARETLERLGVSKIEILQLDPASMKADELDRLVKQVGERVAIQRRLELDVEYAKNLLQVAVSPRVVGGEITFDVQQKDLCRALELLLQSALAENGGEHAREAQNKLEELGVVGARLSGVKQAFAAGVIPEETTREIIVSTCISRLERYKEWDEDADANPEDAARRKVAGELGPALYKYLQKNHAQSAQLEHSSETLNFWRDFSKPRRTD